MPTLGPGVLLFVLLFIEVRIDVDARRVQLGDDPALVHAQSRVAAAPAETHPAVMAVPPAHPHRLDDERQFLVLHGPRPSLK